MISPLASTPRFGGIYPVLLQLNNSQRTPLRLHGNGAHDSHMQQSVPLDSKCFKALTQHGDAPQRGILLPMYSTNPSTSAIYLYVTNDIHGNHITQYGIQSNRGLAPDALTEDLETGKINTNGDLVLHDFKHVTREPATWQIPIAWQRRLLHWADTLKDKALILIPTHKHHY